ncbi:MAG: adenylosuccinate lyase [Bacteroidia bacterium]|nr:adenylosuccinate lyase [Bacteroidia bacterium]
MNYNTPLFCISPVDGRYSRQTRELSAFFSEFALMKYRVRVEMEYLLALSEEKGLGMEPIPEHKALALREVYQNFSEADALTIKETEKTTNHDVKAVEYFVKDRLEKLGLGRLKEMVHFGLTSQDVNNTAIPLSMKEACTQVYLPALDKLIQAIETNAHDWISIAMLARTHGQPASPTKLGKEMMVFVERLQAQRNQLIQVPYSAKFGGATGNFNAHSVAYPQVDWVNFSNYFVNTTLGLSRSQTTTQIEHYDNVAAWCHALERINTILIDFSRDIWTYISMDYFKQKIKEGEVGSSAMPHKVNPIDFENAEGNLGISNALLVHLAAKLPVSRLQRDLTDSTVLRNIGMPLAHTLIAFKSLLKGIDKLIVNEEAIQADLDDNWAVVAEAIQTVLRKEGVPNPYEQLKQLSRTNKKLGQADFEQFIDSLSISAELKAQLKAITPQRYTGVF